VRHILWLLALAAALSLPSLRCQVSRALLLLPQLFLLLFTLRGGVFACHSLLCDSRQTAP
jgi:hypothetical protein